MACIYHITIGVKDGYETGLGAVGIKKGLGLGGIGECTLFLTPWVWLSVFLGGFSFIDL